jgi:hypothetical protein
VVALGRLRLYAQRIYLERNRRARFWLSFYLAPKKKKKIPRQKARDFHTPQKKSSTPNKKLFVVNVIFSFLRKTNYYETIWLQW